jgi:hypothetical protein
MVAECLMECHLKTTESDQPLRLRVFIDGRNRLERISTRDIARAFIVPFFFE